MLRRPYTHITYTGIGSHNGDDATGDDCVVMRFFFCMAVLKEA
jgi:hypothetical protein